MLGLGFCEVSASSKLYSARSRIIKILGFFVVPGGVVLVTKDLAPEQILNKPCFRYIQAWFIRSGNDGGAKLGPRSDFQIFMSFGISGGAALLAKDLAPEQISNKPCTREVQTWILRVLAVGGQELGPGQNFPIFGVLTYRGEGAKGRQGERAQANF